MKVLVTFAVDAEFAPWRGSLGFTKAPSITSHKYGYGPREVYETVISGISVRVLLTGMGWWRAGRAVEMSYKSFVPDICISSGFAGSLKEAYRSGDILVARKIRELNGTRVMESDRSLVELAERSGARAVDCFLGTKRVVGDAQTKRRLGLWGDAVEIESFRVLSAAFGRGIPAVAVRGISDGCDTDLPYDFSKAANREGRIALPSLLVQIARKPQRIRSLIRLGRDSRETAKNLARFLSLFVSSLPIEQGLLETVGMAVR